MDKLRETGFTFSKKYGQNFLTDGNLLRAIAADAGITKADTVLEIGPGAGALTLALAARAGKVVAYEIDRRLEPVLDETLAGCDNVRVVFRDICDVTDDELADAAGSDYILAANLPYYITTPILFRFTECARPPRTMIVMVQKEVADRLTAAPGTPAYGALTASVALTYEARITRLVPRSLFTPAPNVDSAVVRLSFSPKCDDPAPVRALIRAAFRMRRKTLANNLAAAVPRERTQAALAQLGFDPAARGETLSADDFLRLYDILR